MAGRIPVSPDGRYSLAWGAEIMRGSAPDLEAPDLPTPHPLPIAVGALLSLLGPRAAASAYAFLGALAFAALVWGAFLLGQALGGAAPARGRRWGPRRATGSTAGAALAGGLVAAAFVATRPRLDFFASRSFIDVPFAALVLLAAATAARDPDRRTLPLALLALAGLVRPEAWGLAVLFVLVLAARRSLGPRHVALALAGPAGWLGFDLAFTGDALHSLTATQDGAVLLGRETGLQHLWPSLTDGLGDLAGEGAVVGGLLFGAWALRRRDRAAALLAGVALAGIAAFCAIAVADLPLNDRYLLVPALALVVLGGAAAAHAGRSLIPALAAAFALVPAILMLPDDLSDTRDTLDLAASKRRADEDLERLLARGAVERELARCRVVVAAGTARAAVAALTDRDPAAVPIARGPIPPRGAAALSTSETVAPGTPRSVRERAWTFVSRC